jgi:hypothetical protein
MFCLDVIYRHEITREDVKIGGDGNILVDGFDYFGDDDFVDMHELLSTLEIIENYYSDEMEQWILNY